MTLTVTFIRHGESLDNPKHIWAGWKDASLSQLGQQQAKALGVRFAETQTHFTAVYASPLLRAHQTAQAAIHLLPNNSNITITLNPDLREQHFGIAEGHPWTFERPRGVTLDELHEKGVFPVLFDRQDKFPEGESLLDLQKRAEKAIKECVLIHLNGKESDSHIAIASHGLCIGELIAALVRLDPDADHKRSYTGLENTAWTRAVISLKAGNQEPLHPNNPPPLDVRITHVNSKEHLHNLPAVPQVVDDEVAKAARAFFGGELTQPTAISNAGNTTDAKF